MLTRLGMQDGEAIESKMVTRRIEAPSERWRSGTLRSAKTCSNTTK